MDKILYSFLLLTCCWNPIHCLYTSDYDSQNLTVANLINILFENYSDRVRPDVDLNKPTNIKFNIYINTISSVNEISMDLTLNIFLRQWWNDHRLTFPEKYGQISLNPKDISRLWVADIYFPTEKEASSHEITVPNRLVFLEPDGSLYYSRRLTIKSTCAMHLQQYPFDKQTCKIMIEPYASKTSQLLFEWTGEKHVEVDNSTSLPEYDLNRNIETENCTRSFISGTYPCLAFKLELTRMIGYFLIQNYIPSILIVILSWVSFWIDIHATPARISLGLLTVLTMTTQITGIYSRLPRVSYIKAIDVWFTVCMVFVFGALIEFSVVNVLARQDQKRRMLANKKQAATDAQNLRSIVEEAGDKYKVKDEEQVVKFGNRKNNGAVYPDDPDIITSQSRAESQKRKNEDKSGSDLLADKISRLAFPLAFVIFNAGYWAGYLLLQKN